MDDCVLFVEEEEEDIEIMTFCDPNDGFLAPPFFAGFRLDFSFI